MIDLTATDAVAWFLFAVPFLVLAVLGLILYSAITPLTDTEYVFLGNKGQLPLGAVSQSSSQVLLFGSVGLFMFSLVLLSFGALVYRNKK